MLCYNFATTENVINTGKNTFCYTLQRLLKGNTRPLATCGQRHGPIRTLLWPPRLTLRRAPGIPAAAAQMDTAWLRSAGSPPPHGFPLPGSRPESADGRLIPEDTVKGKGVPGTHTSSRNRHCSAGGPYRKKSYRNHKSYKTSQP